MISCTLDEFLNVIEGYPDYEKKIIMKAYKMAEELHSSQFRQSGEPYIVHPLSVAYILAEMCADCDTVCAGLLHDTIEDTPLERETIVKEFNEDVAKLVDGVTKISNMEYYSKEELNLLNTRKIIKGINEDVRIIIVKLADRLHNLRTLSFKPKEKQKKTAMETLEIFVPLAYYIGLYKIKNELEDLSLFYLDKDAYMQTVEKIALINAESNSCMSEMRDRIDEVLTHGGIKHDIEVRSKNTYGVYKYLQKGMPIYDIHDLLAFRVMTEYEYQCYLALGLIHKEYHPVNDRFRDHICNPKANLYQSLHTTVFGPDNRLVQARIRTYDMNMIASYGLLAYWRQNNGYDTRKLMQQTFYDKFQLAESLKELDSLFTEDSEFVSNVKRELFNKVLHVYLPDGNLIQLPVGSSVIDFAYKVYGAEADKMIGALVNGKNKDVTTILFDKDRISLMLSDSSDGPFSEWLPFAYTTRAKSMILRKKS